MADRVSLFYPLVENMVSFYVHPAALHSPLPIHIQIKKCPNFIRTIGRHLDDLMYWLVKTGSCGNPW